MAADLSSLDKTRVADTRYITLTNLYNACSTPQEMDVYRKAVVKLLNSLSHSSDVLRLETIDKERTHPLRFPDSPVSRRCRRPQAGRGHEQNPRGPQGEPR
jgi:hypothetical protein